MSAQQVPASLRTLVARAVDYAGLFPPAGLELPRAVANYADYRRSPHAWMLGRFVLGAAQLDAFRVAVAAHLGDAAWHLSALAGDDLAAAFARVARFNEEGGGAAVDMVEARATTPEQIEAIAAAAPAGMPVYVEIPAGEDARDLLRALAAVRLRAKIRTGGLAREAFPSPQVVARFVRACYAQGVAFKATAGLHHALRAEHALTYEPDSARATMHGFLNVFLTAALCYNGLDAPSAELLMRAADAAEMVFDNDGAAWGEYRVSTDEIATARRRLVVSFGSCSFEEPVDDLAALGLLSEA
ncbi:MAG: hypothetical protein OEO21_09390 [Candidatus Krumholzibacteria bacterium]|nr:hypothetical protein [Candidatus Krumholzibacteria bacterium]